MTQLTKAPRGARKALGALAVLTSLTVGLVGCVGSPAAEETPSSGASSDPNEGTVEFWTVNLKKNFGDYIQNLIDKYETDHPKVKIKWVDVPGADITTKLLAATASGKVPDLVNYTSDTIGLFADSMTDLNGLLSSEQLSVYSPALLEPLKQPDGQLAAVPWYNGGGGSIALWRESVVKEAGFDATNPPKTWEEMLAFAQKVHEKTGIAGVDAMAYSQVLQSNGIMLISADKNTAEFNTPEAAAVLELFKKYYDSGAIASGVLSKDDRGYEQRLTAKNLAFTAGTVSSTLNAVQSATPDVYSDLVVTPGAVGSTGQYYLTAQQVFGIPALSKNKGAAAGFLAEITSPENQLAFCKLVPILPSTPDTLDDAFFKTSSGDEQADTARRLIVENFTKLADGSLGSGNDAALREVLDEHVRSFMRGKGSASDVLTAAEERWNKMLADK